jgi:Protein of unknown function (DUF3017)
MTEPVRPELSDAPPPSTQVSRSDNLTSRPPEAAQVGEPDSLTSRQGKTRRRRRWWDEWPLLVTIATAIAGLGTVASDHFKRGTFLFGAALLLGAVLRAVLSDEQAGLLKVRSRTIDLLTLAFFAVATMTLAVVVPPPSP